MGTSRSNNKRAYTRDWVNCLIVIADPLRLQSYTERTGRCVRAAGPFAGLSSSVSWYLPVVRGRKAEFSSLLPPADPVWLSVFSLTCHGNYMLCQVYLLKFLYSLYLLLCRFLSLLLFSLVQMRESSSAFWWWWWWWWWWWPRARAFSIRCGLTRNIASTFSDGQCRGLPVTYDYCCAQKGEHALSKFQIYMSTSIALSIDTHA